MSVPILRSEEVYLAVVQIRTTFFAQATAEAKEIKKVQNAEAEADKIVKTACEAFKTQISTQFPEDRDKASMALLLVTQPRLFHVDLKKSVQDILHKKESKKKHEWLGFLKA